MRKIQLTVLLAIISVCASSTALATLIGDTITFNTHFPSDGSITSSQDFLVSGGIECSGCPSAGFVLDGQTLDIGDDFIEFNSSFITAFSGPDAIFEFLDLDWIDAAGELVGFSLTTDFASVDDSDVSFTSDSIRIDIGDSGDGSFWRLELDAVHVRVPEPTTIALMGLGLAGLGYRKRKA